MLDKRIKFDERYDTDCSAQTKVWQVPSTLFA